MTCLSFLAPFVFHIATVVSFLLSCLVVLRLLNLWKLFKTFSPDGTLKCRLEKILIFIWKGCPDTYERRDYEALAG